MDVLYGVIGVTIKSNAETPAEIVGYTGLLPGSVTMKGEQRIGEKIDSHGAKHKYVEGHDVTFNIKVSELDLVASTGDIAKLQAAITAKSFGVTSFTHQSGQVIDFTPDDVFISFEEWDTNIELFASAVSNAGWSTLLSLGS